MRKFVIATALLMLTGPFAGRLCAENAPNPPQGLADNAALRYWLAFAMMPHLSAEQEKLVALDWLTAPTDEKVAAIAGQGGQCLEILQRAAELKPCDWGLIFDGPGTLMPHLAKCREIAKLAAVRIRYRGSQGDGAGAVADALAALTLARHVQSDGALISVLVGYAIESMAIQATTPNLAKLDRPSLQKLLAGLDALPPAKPTGEMLLAEKRYMFDWAIDQLKKGGVPAFQNLVTILLKCGNGEGNQELGVTLKGEKPTQEDVDKLVKQLEEGAALHVAWAKMATLPPEEFERRVNEEEARVKKDNPAAAFLMADFSRSRYQEARAEVAMAMFRAAIKIVLDNPKEVVAPLDAQGKPLFEYHKTDNGFDLTSTSLFEQPKPVKLSVPAK